ncbi:beta-ketoacyl synthase [Nostoc sp. HK-01]|nr:beta-ketoacyl synthase [Nostoc sp. HK-01]
MDDSATFQQNGSEIAIIGLSGRFPGAKNIAEFWQNLQAGVESITFFTDEELISSGVEPTIVDNPKYVKARGVLADAELFDAPFFGFTPKEAEITDPQHRLFLECAWSALENAGYNCENYPGSIGVYAGSSLSSYLFNIYINENIRNSVDAHQIAIGGDKDFLSTRVSYKFNLQGPSYTVQTACSTSLVAVHLACQSLLNGECEMALAGGVSISALRKQGYFYKEGGIGSPDGHCRAFDANAQGTVGGEGVGIVVLKRLEDAIADQDTIYAVIKGSATNNDGSQKVSYTAPRIESQAKVIRTAQVVAEVPPETITYIEAHGTGTSLGDPIEIAALTEAFRASTEKSGFCAIGSLKTNSGHLDAAAGIAGLIKTVLALKHQKIPPSLHYQAPNPQIDFANSPFYVNTQLTDWQTNGTPRRAGVSSFGIGGTNAHVILEEAPIIEQGSRGAGVQGRFYLLLLSAKTSTALETATENLVQHLQQNQDINLADVAYTLAVGRKAFEHRRILVCQNLEHSITAFTSPDSPEVFTNYQKSGHSPVVFMFPGQGSQYVDMGKELYESQPEFREQIDYCAELLKPHLNLDLREVLYPQATQTPELTQTAIAQPALFVIEYALAKLWMSWGVHPEAMIGHSIGEYVAATLAGVFNLEDALTLVATRGSLMQQQPGGAMLSVQMSESEIQPFLGGELALAASNSPSSCVVSGTINAIAQLEQKLQQQGINYRRLHTSHAFHSQMMDAVVEPLTQLLQQISLHPPQIPLISNVSGTWIDATIATNPDYWAKHLRQTVLFSKGITELLQQPERIFLEVGSGRTLSTFVKQHQKPEVVTLTSLRHPQEQKSDIAFILNTLGRLWLQGIKVDWLSFYRHEKPYHIPLPTYPFERQRYWIEAQPQLFKAQLEKQFSSITTNFVPTALISHKPSEENPVLLGKKPNIADWFYTPTWKRATLPQLPNEIKTTQSKCWLVFVDECGVGEKIVQRLKLAGDEVITVKADKAYIRHSDRSYTINPEEPQDYKFLCQELRKLGQTPTNILHLWSVTPDHPGYLTSQQYESLGFYSLLFLTQAIAESYPKDTLDIRVIANHLQTVTGCEQLCPEKALIMGPCKVIPQEYSHITCSSIDVVLPTTESWQEQQLINQLVTEISLQPSEQVIAYRGHHRWVQYFAAIQLDTPIQENPRLRKNGVYLITGGLGGVGLALAEYLAKTVQAKLILFGRSPFPQTHEWTQWLSTHDAQNIISQKIQKLQNLQAFGAEIMIVNADVANYEQMSVVVKAANLQFGQINGVIHAAAVLGGGMIQLKTKEIAADALAPKIQGTRVLNEIFQNKKLDFFVLCSSLSSFIGASGLVDYIAENSFLDAFAHYHAAQYSNFITSINWDRWNSLGMALAVEQRHKDITGEELTAGMTVEDGLEVFHRVLCSSNLPQIIVSVQDLHSQLQPKKSDISIEEKLANLNRNRATYPRPNLDNAYVAPRNEIEINLADIWQQLLGIDQVGIHDNFFELGGDSLFATQLVSQLCRSFQVELSYKSFFNSPTIAELSQLIVQNLAEQIDLQDLAQALADIETLSEYEMQTIFTSQNLSG